MRELKLHFRIIIKTGVCISSASTEYSTYCHFHLDGVRCAVNHPHFTTGVHDETVKSVIADVTEM